MLSLVEGESFDLRIKEQNLSCHFLANGNLAKIEDLMGNYQSELDYGKWPFDLRKTDLAAPKAPVVKEVKFLC